MKKLIIIVVSSLLILVGCSSQSLVQETSNNSVDLGSYIIEGVNGDSSYKIGSDIPAGEYYIEATSEPSVDFGNIKIGYVLLKDVPITKAQSDADVFTNIPITNHAYLTISETDGYLALAHAKAYPVQVKPATKVNSDATYDSGMYKVGVDMPAGRYMLQKAANIAQGYYQVTSDSIYHAESNTDLPVNLVAYGPIEANTQKSITLEDGQYINIVGCKLIPE